MGLGIPTLIGLAAGSLYVFKQRRRKDPYLTQNIELYDPIIYPDEQYANDDKDVSIAVF